MTQSNGTTHAAEAEAPRVTLSPRRAARLAAAYHAAAGAALAARTAAATASELEARYREMVDAELGDADLGVGPGHAVNHDVGTGVLTVSPSAPG